MQNLTNQYYNTLVEFNPVIHYLRVDSNNQKLILCNKADLKWTQSLGRLFWKPENERISFIGKQVFEHLDESMFQGLSLDQFNLESQQLTRFFEMLGYVSERADNKLGTSLCRKTALALHSVCYRRVGIVADTPNPETLLKLEKAIDEAAEKKAIVELELGKLQQLVSENAKEVALLESQKSFLQSDTVFWARDGYLVCTSSWFAPQSMVHVANSMVGISSVIQQKLAEIEAVDQEKGRALRLLPKQIYIEDVSIIDLKKYIALLELGPNKVLDYTAEDGRAMNKIADYLLQPVPDLATPYVKELKGKIKKATGEAKKAEEKQKETEKKLKAVKEKVKKVKAGLEGAMRDGLSKGARKRKIQELHATLSRN